jgi:hypothetical protein
MLKACLEKTVARNKGGAEEGGLCNRIQGNEFGSRSRSNCVCGGGGVVQLQEVNNEEMNVAPFGHWRTDVETGIWISRNFESQRNQTRAMTGPRSRPLAKDR